MITIIDADSLCYASAFSVEKEGKVVRDGDLKMYHRLDDAISGIIAGTKADDYKVYLTGKGNFRYDIDPLYKANRGGMKRPALLSKARRFLMAAHDATVVTDMEADDAVCIEATYLQKHDISCCIAHIDKDIDQQEGWHYKWGANPQLYSQGKFGGMLCLYTQALMGDKVDNIMHYKDEETGTWKKDYGLGKVGAAKALAGLTTEKEMYDKCLELYESWVRKGSGEAVTEEDLVRNMQLLYLLRTKDDEWENPE